MTRKSFALLLTIPLMLFFLCDGTRIVKSNKTFFEAGSEMPSTPKKVFYLIPENELTIPENEELSQERKNRLKDNHKFQGKHFVR